MKRKKINLKYRKERALLSDVLPYELPVTFTNRHFYHFILENKLEINNNIVSWLSGCKTTDRLVCLMFDLEQSSIKTEKRFVGLNEKEFNINNLKNYDLIPFLYKVNHKESEFRDLTIPHPRSQLKLIEFYDKSKETIIYHCSKSNFSIRKPVKIAKYRYHKDRTHYNKLAETESQIEEEGSEYQNLRSFFVYKRYSNIYKFYESYQYQRCEKKYNRLLKLDISKCFDSIYTHSLPWALLGKEYAKANLKKSSFADRFDQFMSNTNYRETNGIIIGPEFSRVFAEIILQSIDKEIEINLDKQNGLINRTHYEMFRYVDDYFIFYNDEKDKNTIANLLQHTLKKFKLHLNSAKAVIYDKPLITEISMAKLKIASLLQDKLIYKITEEENDGLKTYKGSIFINSNTLITQFKTIIKECNVSYKDMLNYSLAIVENKCEKILKNYSKTTAENKPQKQIVKALISILNFTFFIYSVSPKVNTTIRLCRIIRMLCDFLSNKNISYENKHLVYKSIFDDINFIIKKNKSDEHTQVETLYLLVALTELGKNYWLEESILAEYFNIEKKHGHYTSKTNLNYLSYTVLLFYMRNKVRYTDLRRYIEDEIKKSFKINKNLLNKKAELIMLLFDLVSCPFVSRETKTQLLSEYQINDQIEQNQILNYKNKYGESQLWFTTWQKFDFGKELDSKQSQEVY